MIMQPICFVYAREQFQPLTHSRTALGVTTQFTHLQCAVAYCDWIARINGVFSNGREEKKK